MPPGGRFKGVWRAWQARAGGSTEWDLGLLRTIGGWPAVAALGVCAVGLWGWPFTVDDAFIVARYAAHVAAGHGYTMNVGDPPTDGVTGPAWVLVMMGGVGLAKGVGLGCAALAAAVAVRWAGRAGGSAAAAASTAFLVAQPTLGLWGVAGVETGAAALALTVAATGTTCGRGIRVGLATAALLWLRPEAVPAALVAVAATGTRSRRAGAMAVGLTLVGAVGVLVFRWSLFGHPLPLALAAKPPDLAHGAAYAARAAVATTGLVALVPAAWGVLRGFPGAPAMAALVGVHVVAVVLAGGDWMPGYRLFAPVFPPLGILVGLGVARLPIRAGLRVVVLGACCVAPLLDTTAQLPEARDAGRRREEVARPLAEWMGEQFQSVALVDAGYLAWASGVRVFDLAGLTDPTIARAPGGHLDKRFDPGLLAAAAPDAIVLHAARRPGVRDGRLVALAGYPVERRVASHPWVRAHYRVTRVVRYAPGYWYVVLSGVRRRQSAVRWGAPLTADR
ncbi:MAG: hypothetical protein ACODAU_10890 [Myxococcota bacterium]